MLTIYVRISKAFQQTCINENSSLIYGNLNIFNCYGIMKSCSYGCCVRLRINVHEGKIGRFFVHCNIKSTLECLSCCLITHTITFNAITFAQTIRQWALQQFVYDLAYTPGVRTSKALGKINNFIGFSFFFVSFIGSISKLFVFSDDVFTDFSF